MRMLHPIIGTLVVALSVLEKGHLELQLRVAARNGNVADLARIVKAAKSGPVDFDLNLDPAFISASAHGRILAMRYLMDKGASDTTGALIAASHRNQIQAARFLVYHEARFVDEIDLRLAMVAAGSTGSAETEFMLLTKIIRE